MPFANFEKQEASAPKVGNKSHYYLLQFACKVVGRDYNVVTSFRSYREEDYTILCGLAFFVVYCLAYGTLFSATNYIVFDLINSESLAVKFDKAKYVLPFFYATAIYIIDRTILNGNAVKNERISEEPPHVWELFLSLPIIKIIKKPSMLFRVSLILCSAVLSTMFVIVNVNEQLMVDEKQGAKSEKIEGLTKEAAGKINAIERERGGLGDIKKNLNDEAQRLRLEIRRNDIEKDQEINSAKNKHQLQHDQLTDKLQACAIDAACIQQARSHIDSIDRAKSTEIRSIGANYKNKKKDIEAQLGDVNAKIKANESDIKQNTERRSNEDDLLKERKIEVGKNVSDEINRKKSFAGLLRYMLDGNPDGKIISGVVFVVLLIFFGVVDGAVIVLKFSYKSLYDVYQDHVDKINESKMKKSANALGGSEES